MKSPIKLPGRFEWKILGAMLLVGVLSMGAGVYALQYYLRSFSSITLEHQRDVGEGLARAVEVFRAYFDDRKKEFRRRTAEIAAQRPASMQTLASTDGLLTARLLRTGGVIDEWQAPPDVLAGMQRSPPFLAEMPPVPGEDRASDLLELTFGISKEMYGNFEELRDAVDREREMDRAFSRVVPRMLRDYLSVVILVLIVPPLVGVTVARRVTKRVARLRDAAARVGRGDLTVRVNPTGKDELDDLGRAFDGMVTEIAGARSRLEYLQKVSAWQEVARRLAHEIKNPLTPIQLAVQELVSRYRGDDAAYRRLLETAREILDEEIAGLRRLVDDFSAFAKLSRADPVAQDLGGLVGEFVRQHPEFEKFTRVVVPATPVWARCDKILFRRVLTNLVENAVQAAEGAGRKPEIRVTVQSTPGDDRVAVLIDDNGPGVPADDRQRIFDPYITNKEGGTGLGLAIVRKIVIDHDGDIRAGGPAPGLGGARFEVRIPSARPTGSSPA